jgi:hypothetical protein
MRVCWGVRDTINSFILRENITFYFLMSLHPSTGPILWKTSWSSVSVTWRWILPTYLFRTRLISTERKNEDRQSTMSRSFHGQQGGLICTIRCRTLCTKATFHSTIWKKKLWTELLPPFSNTCCSLRRFYRKRKTFSSTEISKTESKGWIIPSTYTLQHVLESNPGGRFPLTMGSICRNIQVSAKGLHDQHRWWSDFSTEDSWRQAKGMLLHGGLPDQCLCTGFHMTPWMKPEY